jgi:glyoxylase-like metal-dependent hydrolase (beta-lactamase superfamily II)
MRKYETGFFGGPPGRWESEAKQREDMRASRLKPPTLLYRDVMIFDDGTHRVELRYFGVGHTRGDGFAWLPKERILFTGDAAVNGPFNYMGDGDSGAWIETLANAQKLGANVIAPGHGPAGDGSVLEGQRRYFLALRAEVEKRKGLTPAEVQADVSAIREVLLKHHPTYVEANAKSVDGFGSQVEQVYRELTGNAFPKKGALDAARQAHLNHHARPGDVP